MPRVFLIGTFETKSAELGYLSEALARSGLDVTPVDVSLASGGVRLTGADKIARMEARAQSAAEKMARNTPDHAVAVGVGGGTGGEIVLAALKGLPATYPKILVTTMAFDPRAALADSAITLVPTLCDIEGLNPMLRQVFENTAAMAAGLVEARTAPALGRGSVAMTTLGATGPAALETVKALATYGLEATVFHANGYGGAAFARFVEEGRADAVIDLNVHELGRVRLAGAHVPIPTRFTAAGALPCVVLPGALNFIGLGAIDTVPQAYLSRPHYRHSGYFTHVKLTEAEMSDQAAALAALLNARDTPADVLIPMGGFSHEDRPGGAIEDPVLREIAADILEGHARRYRVERLDAHINSQLTAARAAALLAEAIGPRSMHA
ncbi:MAG: Tm-1-like ATP-binding domain-containing protein [Pseudomonadota bacterium]